jgi:phosphoglycerate dehydrogenase-like enzyme
MTFNVINTQKHLTDEAIRTLESAECRVRYVNLVSLDENEMCREIADADGVVAGSERYTPKVFAAADRLKVIARTGVGVDQIDLVAATRHGVYITNTPGATNAAVAEFTIGVIICMLRGVFGMATAMRLGEWRPTCGRELGNLTLGIVGAGGIGKRVISIARGFGTQVLAYDISIDVDFAVQWDFEYVSLEQLLRRSDVVSIHCGLSDSTRGMIGSRELDLMKRDAYLVNTARPSIVDHDALARKLKSRELAGAAIDVHDPVPCGPEDGLVALDNVLPTCWSAYNTHEAIADMSQRAAEDLIAVLKGRDPRHPVNHFLRKPALTNR